MKEIIKDLARNTPSWKHLSELKKIRHLPVVHREMHQQKKHLFEIYRKECKRLGRKPFML